MNDSERLSTELFGSWMAHDEKMTTEVMSQDKCEIEPGFMCFCDIYWHLAQIIPKHWTIVDLGCAFAPQCWYFKDHAKYIGVDPGKLKRFKTPNAEFFEGTIKDLVKNWDGQKLDRKRTFAIMSYVPADDYSYFLAKTYLDNLFVYYPSADPIKLRSVLKNERMDQSQA